jgi:hypothetical protein
MNACEKKTTCDRCGVAEAIHGEELCPECKPYGAALDALILEVVRETENPGPVLTASTCVPLAPFPRATSNAWEEKKAARIERLRTRSARLARAGESRIDLARKRASCIPFGQPILVGHYSEGRDRNFRAKIDGGFRKGFALTKEAQELDARADAAEASTAVSSDDPDAVAKLREKLAGLEADHAKMLDFNKLLRGKKTDEEIAAAIGWKVTTVASLRKPDFAGRPGFPPYKLTNNGGEIRRVKGRIEALTRVAAKPEAAPEEIGETRIEESKEDNRLRVFFPGKPSEAVRSLLKREGFRWSPSVGAWQRQPNEYAWLMARKAAALVQQEAIGKVLG